jgi:uncharacterized protein
MGKTIRRWSVRTVSLISISAVCVPGAWSAPLPGSIFDACILRPVKCESGEYHVKAVNGVKCSDVFFPASNGKILHAWHFDLPGATKTVLVSHGIGGNISSRVDLIQLYLNAGVSVFIYDYQGYGRSDGNASLKNVVGDGQAAYDYVVTELGVQPSNLILAGESLGTGVTCRLARLVRCAGMILQSPFSSLSKRCAEVIPLLGAHPKWLQPTSGLNNDDALKQPHPPLLIVHGDRDRTVPVTHAFKLYQDSVGPKELLVINGAGHTGDPALMYSPQYLGSVKQFIHDLTNLEAPLTVPASVTDVTTPEAKQAIGSFEPAI